MSQAECKVENISEYSNTQYSGGDNNEMKLKQLYQEENNNDIDEITKNFDMGCIVDKVKRPPNICVETCVYNSDSETEKSEENYENDDVHYSDEFEEDSEVEEIKTISKSLSTSSCIIPTNNQFIKAVKMTNSHTSVSSKQTMSGRSDYGSISVPQTRRINMSFTNERLREIERHNHILLNKILGARNNKKASVAPNPQKKPIPPAAVHRKLKQRQIDHDNMVQIPQMKQNQIITAKFDKNSKKDSQKNSPIRN